MKSLSLIIWPLGLAFALLVGLMTEMPRAVAQSNVVVIISDDAGWADYGFMRDADSAADPGNRGSVPTPNLDMLAAQGVTFTNAYTGSVCSPSRAMITTGQYGTRFGYGSNIAGGSGAINNTNIPQGLPTEAVTVWERMQAVGYDTAAVGKWHIGEHSSGGGQLGNRPEHQGVEFFQGLWAGSRGYFAGSQTGSGQLRETVSDGAGSISSNSVIEGNYTGQYVTDVFGDQSADYIRDSADNADPFFLYSSFTAPHTPMQATTSDLAFIDSLNEPGFTGNRRTYAAMQYAMDRNVGKILNALQDPAGDGNAPGNDSDSVLEDTLIIFMNDNGGDCCDSGPNASDNGDLKNGKGSQFEGGMRVPMIVAGAGVNIGQRGSVSTDLVHSVDIVPTALEGAGGGAFGTNEVIDGKNLLPYINNSTSGVAHENLFISRYNNQQSAVRLGDWKYMYQNGSGYQLYNLATDLDESNNVVSNTANAAVVAEAHQLLASYHVQMDKPRHDNQADETNQFDHFRFRDEALTVAAFSTANAWTNGDTGSGNFTATWRDGYANNELTFRAKATGSYTATNDLNSVGGLAYMANRINLDSAAAALSNAQKATINGLPVMLAKNLSDVAPQINLDATDPLAKTFTFEIDHDIEIYDDLTIQGDGNQNFVINGRLQEFRAGRSVTKTGSSDLTLGGGVDISGTLDLQGGKVAFTDGQVRGNVLVQAASAIVVGGVGFNQIEVPTTGPQIVTTNLELHYDAAADTGGDSIWTEATGSGNNLSFSGSAGKSTVNEAAFPGITQAYDISLTGDAGGLSNFFETNGPRSRQDATFEVWFNVSDLAASGNQVLFEVGATRGVSLTLNNDTLAFNVDGDGSLLTLSETVGMGWHQAVGVIDLGPGNNNDSISLFVDNNFVGTLDNLLVNDWAGGNNGGIGGDSAGTAGGSPTNYHGEIAAARYYQNFVFGATEVDQNYQAALTGPDLGSLVPTLLDIEGTYTQLAGSLLELDLLDTLTHDAVNVSEAALLEGTLKVEGIDGFSPEVGDSFTVLNAAGGVSGEFAVLDLPTLSGMQWYVEYSSLSVTLNVILGADFNADGSINGADYLVWQRGLGSIGQTDNSLGDADGNGVVDSQDLSIWRDQFGTSPGNPFSVVEAVPELSTGITAVWGSVLLACMRCKQLVVRAK